MFSPWYSWTTAELTLNNNHPFSLRWQITKKKITKQEMPFHKSTKFLTLQITKMFMSRKQISLIRFKWRNNILQINRHNISQYQTLLNFILRVKKINLTYSKWTCFVLIMQINCDLKVFQMSAVKPLPRWEFAFRLISLFSIPCIGVFILVYNKVLNLKMKWYVLSHNISKT